MATSSSVARIRANENTDSSFDYIGLGFCRDSDNSYDSWLTVYGEQCLEDLSACQQCGLVDLSACQERCKALDKCVGISWTIVAPYVFDGSRCVNESQCVVYYGKATPEVPIMVEKSTLTETDTSLLKVFTCYAYQPETPIKDDNTGKVCDLYLSSTHNHTHTHTHIQHQRIHVILSLTLSLPLSNIQSFP